MTNAPKIESFLALGIALAVSSAATAAPPRPDLTVDLAIPAVAAAGSDIGPQEDLPFKPK